MSLIEEALRRVQAPGVKPPPSTPASPTPEHPTPPPIHSWSTSSPGGQPSPSTAPQSTKALFTIAAAIIGLTVVLVIGGAFWIGRAVGIGPGGAGSSTSISVNPTPLVQPSGTSPSAVVSGASVPAPAASQRAPQPALVLSGVVEGLGQPYAVINGMIVGLGETFEGATLVDIQSRSATLQMPDGRTTVLEISQ